MSGPRPFYYNGQTYVVRLNRLGTWVNRDGERISLVVLNSRDRTSLITPDDLRLSESAVVEHFGLTSYYETEEGKAEK